jgi:hypothetical protein
MNRTTITKVLSISLSLALGVSSIPVPAGALGPVGPVAPSFVERLTPPAQFGYVSSSYAPNGEDKPRLIVIADLHGHMGVQHNIMSMLEFFTNGLSGNSEGKVQPVTPIFLEGGWKPHLEEPLQSVKNPKARAVLADYLLNKSELAAGQAFSERHPGATNFTLTGVENQNEYEANRQRFAQTYPMRKAVLLALAHQEETVRTLEGDLENSKFEKFRDMREDYLKGTMPANRYARVLRREAASLGITSGFMTILKNSDTASDGDLEVALTEINRLVLEALSSARPVTSYLRPAMTNEERIRKNLALIEGNMDLLKRVVGEQLTPDEVGMAYAKLPELIEVATVLLANEKLSFDIGESLRKSLEFYPLAFMRDESLVSNSLAALAKDPTHPQTGILIAGGFHTGSISTYLREHGIAHMVIDPMINRELTAEEQLNYVKRVCLDHVTPSEMIYDLSRPQNAQILSNPLALPINTLTTPPIDPKKGNTFSLQLLDNLATTAEQLQSGAIAKQLSSLVDAAQTVAARLSRPVGSNQDFVSHGTEADLVADEINSIRQGLKDDAKIHTIDVQIVPNGTLHDDEGQNVPGRATWDTVKGYGKIQIEEGALKSKQLGRVVRHEAIHILNPEARETGREGEVPAVIRDIALNAGRRATADAIDAAASVGVTLATVVPAKVALESLKNAEDRISDDVYNKTAADLAAKDVVTVGEIMAIMVTHYMVGPDMSNPVIRDAVLEIAQETGVPIPMAEAAVRVEVQRSLTGSNSFSKDQKARAEGSILTKLGHFLNQV